MISWLNEKGIKFDTNSTKKQLYEMIKTVSIDDGYVVDSIIKSAGHIPMRTPYNCEVYY